MVSGNFFNGMSYFRQGFGLIREPGLRLFVILPLILNIIIFALFVYAFGSLYDALVLWLMNLLPEWLSFLDWLLWAVYGALVIVIFAYGFVVVANIIGSPFYGYLSELTQKRLTGQDLQTDDDWKEILKTIPRSISREIYKLVYYIPRALVLLFIGMIPVVNVIAAVLWFVFSAWMMALQYVDYPSDNSKQSFTDLKRYLQARRLTALGFGILAYLASLVPLLNLVAIPASVCGATAFWVKESALDGGQMINLHRPLR
jgi:CysZ protein